MSLWKVFERSVRLYENKTALIFGEERISYKQLYEKSCHIADHLYEIAGGKEQNGDCGMATELTGMGVVVSALLGLLETCLIFLGLRLSFSFIPVFSVAVLWASLSILTGAFLELLLSIFGQSVYTDIRLQAEPYDRSGRRR